MLSLLLLLLFIQSLTSARMMSEIQTEGELSQVSKTSHRTMVEDGIAD